MQMPYTQENRLIAIDTPLGKDELLLTGFSGTEGLSSLFHFDLKMLSENHTIAFENIIGKVVTVSIILADGDLRFFNGLISRFSQGRGGGESGEDVRFSHYTATMVPWLWLLTQTADSRIFQNVSVPEIVEKIFTEGNFSDFKLALHGQYGKREYCVQYRETDFNFVSRLLEEEGIYYFFEHEEGKHTLVLADVPDEHKPCPKQESARYQVTAGGWVEDDVITSLEKSQEIRPGKYALNDYYFETPNADLSAAVPGKQPLGPGEKEIYDYPGLYTKRADGDHFANIRMQEEEARITTITGSSVCRAFTSGYKFDLEDYYRDDMTDKPYVLISIHHEASQGLSYPGVAKSEGSEFSYVNHFTCIPFDVPFRPPRHTPKPVVRGTQTAIVVGPAGEEIYPDKYGRVKVQFHWDREGKGDENSSCWIRVAQLWASAGWGGIYIPRMGQEVVVDFLEGDPDRPIIIGCVYHGNNMPPYALPDEKTKSGIKSDSSLGGGGFNEIRFEDKKGDEQIFIHGEKDADIRIKNDSREWIGNDRHLIVTRDKVDKIERDRHVKIERDEIREIARDHHLKIKGKEAIELTGSHSFSVQGDVIEVFKANHSERVTQNYYVKGMNVVVEGMTGLTVKVGGNFITINPGGVFITGTMVMINSGGAAGSGTAGSPVPPVAPLAAAIADTAIPGKEVTYKQQQAQMTPAQLAASKARSHKPTEEDKEKKSWIEIELVDEEDNPVPGERYRITLPDGETLAEGTLDQKGFARVEGIDPGTCKITFPSLDKDAWQKI